MSNRETDIMRRQMLALSRAGHLAFRNETGVYWAGRVIHQDGGIVTLSNARRVASGLCVGSHDIVICRSDGRFCSVESKVGRGRPTKEQLAFADAIVAHGGNAGVAWSVEQALEIVER